MEERLQKVLAAAGVASRRKAEELIASGKVAVDGKVVKEPGTKADPDRQTITVDGRPIKRVSRLYYILLNKPQGYTSTKSDPHALHTVLELVDEVPVSLHPVGRLDVDTEGMLILTNDGDFTYLLTHPKHEIPKTYVATVRGAVGPAVMSRLEQGVELEDGKTAPARARVLDIEDRGRFSVVELTIAEGKKRQVRRMFQAVGHRVEKLVRTRVGDVELGRLRSGTWRHLTPKEVERLKSAAKRESKQSAVSSQQ